jgi:hypothetical protein
MPRNHAIIASDLLGKLWIECDKCGRRGCYRLCSLPADKSLIEFREELTVYCERRKANKFADLCGARFPDLPKVL